MSSDEYFGDELDSAFLHEVDAIEAAHVIAPTAVAQPTTAPRPPAKTAKPASKHPTASRPAHSSSPQAVPKYLPANVATKRDVIELDDSSDYGDAFDDLVVDEDDLARIDQAVQREYDAFERQKEQSAAGPSRPNSLARRPSKGAQLNLFGEVARETEPSKTIEESSKRTFQRTRSTLKQMPLPGQAKRTKQWDRTAYAKTGWRKPKAPQENGKGKGRASDDEDDEPIEFEQFPVPEIPVGPVPPMKLDVDRLAAKTWIYPLNKPKRDYQYNIVKKCLLENTLVALPTGLGKTFIAGVVMLNFFNWFPQGKVIFVAPTKPLVAQQIDACHKACGIPGSAAAELTGSVTKDRRINAWSMKRVFYATPQTLLNDLINGHVDALDIVLIVVDEAHRGTGDYAYAQVVRYMMQHNPHFRILALTATPGGKPEVVQEIVDALHISHIEIRSESDSDLKKYLHTKVEQEHFVQMTEDIVELKEALVALISPILKKVQNAGFLKNGNTAPALLHPFRCQSTIGEMAKARAPPWAMAAAAQLAPLARAMGYLMEMSINMCYGYLKAISDGTDDTGSKKAVRKVEAFKSVMKKFEEQAARGFSMHPKMDLLRTLLIDHFAKELPNEADGATAPGRQSRAMVFVSFRECVEEIVELLNKDSPIIRAKPFIGQGTDKHGKKGYAQKEQLEVIEKFKAGTYNVLVSTSIGEEGLDIGEVDVIVCYDAQKTPIRMLQRIGRTGRKASGTVHILLAQGREEHNWQKAQSNYADVQHFIVRASDLEVYADVDRLLPDDIEPECVEMEMEIEPYVRDERSSYKGSLDGSLNAKGKKRKRDDDPKRNVPVSAAKGFVSVSELLLKGAAKRKKKVEKVDIERADEDDSDDEDIEAGIFGPRRTQSASAASAPKKDKKKGLTRSATIAGPSKKKSVGPKKGGKQAILARLDIALNEDSDSDDEEIERGLLERKKPPSRERRRSAEKKSNTPPRIRQAKSLITRSSSPDIPLNDSVIDISSTPGDSQPGRSVITTLNSSPDRPLNKQLRLKRRVIDSSPDRPLMPISRSTDAQDQRNKSPQSGGLLNYPGRLPSHYAASETAEKPAAENESMAWLIEDDEDPVGPWPELSHPAAQSSAKLRLDTISDDEPLSLGSPSSPKSPSWHLSDDIEFVDDPPVALSHPSTSNSAQSGKNAGSLFKTDMGPPALPTKITDASSHSDDWPPPATFAVRAPGRHVRKRVAAEAFALDSSPLSMPPPSQRRLQRDRPRSPSPPAPQPPKKKKRKFRDAAEAQRHNPWIDLEATHSGDELSVGSSEPDVLADSDDHMFLDEPPETQVSPSYDQSAVYRRSLMTQVPGGGGPMFANGPVRRGQASFGPIRAGSSRYSRALPSSPTNEDEEPNEYEFGSFVVDDETEIAYTNAPSSDL